MRVIFPAAFRISASLASVVVAAVSLSPAEAQNLFPCGGGPNEQQVGVDMNGPVTVPLCIERPGGQYGGSATRSGPTV